MNTLEPFTPSIDWGNEFLVSLIWIVRAWAIAAACTMVVLVLIARFTTWGRQFWHITGAYFTGRQSVKVWLWLARLLLSVIAGVRRRRSALQGWIRLCRMAIVALVAVFFAPGQIALAHIGSPDVFLDTQAGPYRLLITVRTPRAIPGVAEVEILTTSPDIREVRIVHGFGTGQLRKGLHAFLKTHPLVAKFHAAPENQGGGGATIVELRD